MPLEPVGKRVFHALTGRLYAAVQFDGAGAQPVAEHPGVVGRARAAVWVRFTTVRRRPRPDQSCLLV
jgi:hypothetical protein